jgi:AraC-like DNA-binding protein
MYNKIPRYKSKALLRSQEFEITSLQDFYFAKKVKEKIFKPHRVSFYTVIWFKGENNFFYVNGEKLRLDKNNLLILNKDVAHRFYRDTTEGEIILFSNVFFMNTQEKTDFVNTYPLFKNAYSVIKPNSDDFISLLETYFSFMAQKIDNNRNRELSVLRNLLHNLLMIVEREFKRQRKIVGKSPFSGYIVQFKSLLNEHYRTQKQVSFYAKAMDITERKLSMIISKTLGISPKEYINEKVFREVKKLLKYSTFDEKEIAQMVGFDFTYFVKFFKKHQGTTPGYFRNHLR